MKRMSCWITAILGLVLLSACASVQRSGPALIPAERLHQPPPAEAQALWEKALREEQAGRTAQAISFWESIARSYPNNAIAAAAYHRIGSAYLAQGQTERALEYLDYVVYAYPQWYEVDLARVDLLRAQWRQGERKRVEKEAEELWKRSGHEPAVQVRLAVLMTDLSRAEGDTEAGFQWAAAGFARARTDQEKADLAKATIKLLESADEAVIKKLAARNPDAFMRFFLEFRLAQIAVEKDPSDVNREALYRLLRENPSHPLTGQVQATLRSMGSDVNLPLHADRIGCLVPLNGSYERYGRNVLRGLLLAAYDWNKLHADQPVTVIVKDTEARPETAVKSFQDLCKKEGVLAVIGPLGTKSAEAVIPVADRWNVPLLTLSRKDEESGTNPFAIHAFLDNGDLVRTLVRYCRERLGYTRFAALYPNDRYGNRLAEIFAEVVEEQGGDLLASVPYDQNMTDFKVPIQRLMKEAKRNSLPSGLDVAPFEALFIPDQVRTVSLIAPQLPYYDVVGATLMGTNLWGEGDLVQMGGVYTEHALYATPFSPVGQGREIQWFRRDFQNRYESPPNYLAAQAYDAMMMLLQARYALNPDSMDRIALMENLMRIQDFNGLTGTCSVQPDGKLARDYLVLQITNGQVLQVYP